MIKSDKIDKINKNKRQIVVEVKSLSNKKKF